MGHISTDLSCPLHKKFHTPTSCTSNPTEMDMSDALVHGPSGPTVPTTSGAAQGSVPRVNFCDDSELSRSVSPSIMITGEKCTPSATPAEPASRLPLMPFSLPSKWFAALSPSAHDKIFSTFSKNGLPMPSVADIASASIEQLHTSNSAPACFKGGSTI